MRASPAPKVAAFATLIESLRAEVDGAGPADALTTILERVGYVAWLGDETREDEARVDNVGELLSAARRFQDAAETPTVAAYLENVALVTELDRLDTSTDFVTLMTLHAAKGLEYPLVFLIGLEEQTFPHARAYEDDAEMEEERRLCYVGITRARQRLILTTAQMRSVFGSRLPRIASRFARSIPQDLLEVTAAPEREDFVHEDRGADESPWSTQMARRFRGRSWDEHDQRTEHDTDAPIAPARFSERAYKETLAEVVPAAPFEKGARVRHAQFGVGSVRAVEGSGATCKVVVTFPGIGEKKIIARFLAAD